MESKLTLLTLLKQSDVVTLDKPRGHRVLQRSLKIALKIIVGCGKRLKEHCNLLPPRRIYDSSHRLHVQ